MASFNVSILFETPPIHYDVVNNWDGIQNNVLFGTWDGMKWSCFPYDCDQTLGRISSGTGEASPYVLITNNTWLFNTLRNALIQKLKARYVLLRKAGVISVENIHRLVKECDAKISHIAKNQDIAFFGAYPAHQQIPFILKWVYQRIRFLDAYYEYSPSDSIALKRLDPLVLSSDQTRTYSYTVTTTLPVGTVLNVEFGLDLLGTTMAASITESNTITLVHTNNTGTSVDLKDSYVRFF